MTYSLNVVTPPSAVALLSLVAAKAHLKVTHAGDDDYITALIEGVRNACEDYTGMTIGSTVFDLAMDYWPTGQEPWWDGVREGDMSLITRAKNDIEIPRPPLISIDSVNAYDDSDVATLMDAATYYVDKLAPRKPGRLVLRRGAVWPVALRMANAIIIRFTAGYTPTTLPEGFKQAMKMMLLFLYNTRGNASEATQIMGSCGASTLLGNYRILGRR